MIDNLRLTTDRNTEQDWLKTNLARFTGMPGQRDLTAVGQLLLGELVPLIDAHQGVIYQIDAESLPILKILAAMQTWTRRTIPTHRSQESARDSSVSARAPSGAC